MNRFFCYHCGADWSDWPGLSGEEREAVLEGLPAQERIDTDPSALPHDCPSCGFPYRDDDDEAWVYYGEDGGDDG